MTDWGSILAEALPKALLYASVQLAVGAAIVRGMVGADRSAGPRPASGAPAERWLARVAFTLACLVAAAFALRAVAHTGTAFGFSDISTANLWTIVGESRWGLAWQRQMLAAIALTIAAALVAANGATWTWSLYGAAAVLCCATLPLLGHGAGSLARGAIHTLHVLGSGAWMGTLAILTAFTVRARGDDSRRLAERLIAGFHLVALPAAGLVAATGAVAAVLYVGEIANLWTTEYGRALTLKLAAVTAAAACGWRNWQRARRDRPLHLPTLVTELALAVIAVGVTSVLTELEHP